MMRFHVPIVVALFALGCQSRPVSDKDPLQPVREPLSSVDSAASAGAEPAGGVASFTAKKFAPAGIEPRGMFLVEGGIVVTEGQRIGLANGEGVTSLGSIPKGSSALGDNRITSVQGRAPDMVSVIYVSGDNSALRPTYFPLSDKEKPLVVAEDGGAGFITGVARVGEAVFLSVSDNRGSTIVQVRGPKLARPRHTHAEAGCSLGEVAAGISDPSVPAIFTWALQSAPSGTMMSLGKLCEKRGPAAEVWDKDGNRKIVDLTPWWKSMSYFPTILKGNGDELWLYSDELNPIILHYKDGAIVPVPELRRQIADVFVSARGELFVSDGAAIYHFEGGKWSTAGVLPADIRFHAFAYDDKGMLWASSAGVYRLQPGPRVAAPKECDTPFVYLHEVSSEDGKENTYPAMRKALAAFPEASALGLLEFGPKQGRHLGITVKSWVQGEAVVAHVKAAMKDQHPHVVCYKPKDVRGISLDAK